MASLKEKIKVALDESRMLVLGAEILLGFHFRVVFEPAFERLPPSSQYLKMAALLILLAGIALVMAPGSYHRIVCSGNDHRDVHQFATTVMDVALVPFVIAFSFDIYLSTGRILGARRSIMKGTFIGATALFFWYGFGFLSRGMRKKKPDMKEPDHPPAQTRLADKIDQVLTEARVVLPGAQALLGFQFVTMFMDAFDKLPNSSKTVHMISLILMAVTMILLMSPAAYHRIAEQGEDTERVYRVASGLLIAAMVTVPLGICGDVYIVFRKVTESISLSIGIAAAVLVFFYGLWFGYTFYRRVKLERES